MDIGGEGEGGFLDKGNKKGLRCEAKRNKYQFIFYVLQFIAVVMKIGRRRKNVLKLEKSETNG